MLVSAMRLRSADVLWTKMALHCISIATAVIVLTLQCVPSRADNIPPCSSTSNVNTSISFLGTQGAAIFNPPLITHHFVSGEIYLRNESSFPLTSWCFDTHLSNYRNQQVHNPQLTIDDDKPLMEKLCVSSVVTPGTVKRFTVGIDVDKNDLPVAGFLTIHASGVAEYQKEPVSGVKLVRNGGEQSESIPTSKRCEATTKEIIQPIVLPAVGSSMHAEWVVIANASIALMFLGICVLRFRKSLMRRMGASQWTFSSSTVTNLAVVGSLLGMVLISTSIPDFPHYMSKQTYVVLGLMFAVIAGLSPVIYSFLCKPAGIDPANQQQLVVTGWVWLLLLADSLTIWAVCGQLATLMLLFDEFSMRQFISGRSAKFAWSAAVMVAVALFMYCYRTVRFYVEEHPLHKPTEATANVSELRPPTWTPL